MAKYVMALDAGQPATDVFYLTKRRDYQFSARSLLNIFRNRAGWSMMQMKSGLIS